MARSALWRRRASLQSFPEGFARRASRRCGCLRAASTIDRVACHCRPLPLRYSPVPLFSPAVTPQMHRRCCNHTMLAYKSRTGVGWVLSLAGGQG